MSASRAESAVALSVAARRTCRSSSSARVRARDNIFADKMQSRVASVATFLFPVEGTCLGRWPMMSPGAVSGRYARPA
eukprot:632680-Prymnesium_polylepis.2